MTKEYFEIDHSGPEGGLGSIFLHNALTTDCHIEPDHIMGICKLIGVVDSNSAIRQDDLKNLVSRLDKIINSMDILVTNLKFLFAEKETNRPRS